MDDQVSKLQAALRGLDDDELQEIAEFGLNGVTGGFKVPVMAAIREFDGANPGKRRQLAPKAVSAINGFRQHLTTDERVAVCDENPFGVAVSIRATLVPALEQLAQTIERLGA